MNKDIKNKINQYIKNTLDDYYTQNNIIKTTNKNTKATLVYIFAIGFITFMALDAGIFTYTGIFLLLLLCFQLNNYAAFKNEEKALKNCENIVVKENDFSEEDIKVIREMIISSNSSNSYKLNENNELTFRDIYFLKKSF